MNDGSVDDQERGRRDRALFLARGEKWRQDQYPASELAEGDPLRFLLLQCNAGDLPIDGDGGPGTSVPPTAPTTDQAASPTISSAQMRAVNLRGVLR